MLQRTEEGQPHKPVSHEREEYNAGVPVKTDQPLDRHSTSGHIDRLLMSPLPEFLRMVPLAAALRGYEQQARRLWQIRDIHPMTCLHRETESNMLEIHCSQTKDSGINHIMLI